MRFHRLFIAITFALTPVILDAQEISVGTDQDKPIEERILYNHETTLSATIHTQGLGVGFKTGQTVADFESRLGSSAKASQVLGNVNNLISLRVIDKETREYISESLPKTRIMFRSQSAVRNQSADELTSLNLSVADNLTETEMEIFPASMLAELPDLEFIARVGGSTVIKGKLPFITV